MIELFASEHSERSWRAAIRHYLGPDEAIELRRAAREWCTTTRILLGRGEQVECLKFMAHRAALARAGAAELGGELGVRS
jgi:hypothetical protein